MSAQVNAALGLLINVAENSAENAAALAAVQLPDGRRFVPLLCLLLEVSRAYGNLPVTEASLSFKELS